MKVLLVAGARPNFMKVAPLLAELERREIPSLLVHTGQHYDADMSGSFFEDLGMREPDLYLGVGSGSHAVQTARLLEALEPAFERERPDWVVTVGDVNSTLAAALVTAKLRPAIGCRLAHVEAGLRSGDWDMPEEVNRVLTDRVSDLLLTTEPDGERNLAAEGIPGDRVVHVGNVMVDTLLASLERARQRHPAIGGETPYLLVTLHRPSNVDHREQLEPILRALGTLAREIRVVLPLHPRTKQAIARHGLDALLDGIEARQPARYLEMAALMDGATAVLTDSGGVQEETTVLGVPCLTLRSSTERPITVERGTNRMVPWPMTTDGIVTAAQERLRVPRANVTERAPDGWDGKAAVRVVDALSARPAPARRPD